jgi:hypothetical protein
MRTQHFGAVTIPALLAAAALSSFGCGKKSEPAEVVIALSEAAAPLSSATVLVDYSQASATLVKTGGEPACAAILPNMTAHFSDDGQGRMTIQANAPQGISAPVDLAVCRMVPDAPGIDGREIASRLRISLVAGADRAGAALDEKKLARAGGKRDGADAGHAEDSPSAHGEGDTGGVAGERAARGHDAAAVPGQPGGAGAGPAEERLAAVPQQPNAAMQGGAPPAPAAQPKSLVPPSSANRAGAPSGDSGGDGSDDGGDDTGDDNQDPGEADANDDSDTDRSARSFAVTVGVNNAAGRLGALQFDISFRGSGRGGFAGAAGSARCQTEIPAALATFNDKGNGTLSGALVDLDGIETPGAVATCTFKSRENVSAGDFSIRVVDAADVEGGAPVHAPQMGVQNLRAQ